MMNRGMIILLWALVLSAPALSQATEQAEVLSAMQNFERAAAGDKDAVEEAMAQFAALREAEPKSPVYLARLGSLMTMQGRDAWTPWKKMSYTERGLDNIDEALASLSSGHDARKVGDIHVGLDTRYTAAVTFSSIPKFFNRWAQAERLLNEITQLAVFGETDKAFQAQVWLTRAQLAKRRERHDESTQWLRKAVALAPQSEAGQQAGILLAGGGGK
jgi:tetratricopeptide (TPR) repeat protein